MRSFLLVGLFLLNLTGALAQSNIPINAWRSHLPYNPGLHLTEAGNRIYCATAFGLFYYDRSDKVLKGLSKVDGFSDVFTRKVAYDESTGALFVTYADGNIDMLKGNAIVNITSLRGKAEIRGLAFGDGKCFISTTIGVSEFNISREEFGNSYQYIDTNCNSIPYNDVAIVGDTIFAASPQGVQKADKNNIFLANCVNWEMVRSRDSCGFLASFAGRLWGGFKDGYIRYYENGKWTDLLQDPSGRILSMEVDHGFLIISSPGMIYKIDANLQVNNTPSNQQSYVIMDRDGVYWLANNEGLWGLQNGNVLYVSRPNGPDRPRATAMYGYDGLVWVATGGVNAQGALNYDNSGFYNYFKNTWFSYNTANNKLPVDARDLMHIRPDTLNGHVFISSLSHGLLEYHNGNLIALYDASNSTLEPSNPNSGDNASVSGLGFDKRRNLWMTNYRAAKPLAVRKPNGVWKSFSVPGSNELLDLQVDDYGNAWVFSFRTGTIAVYNPGANIDTSADDESVLLRNVKGQGNLPGATILSLVKDKNGQMWVGTDDGVAVFPDPALVFTDQNYDAQRIWIRDGENSGYLLTGQQVNAIAVDGGNRKWFATSNGVWLTNPDGDEIIAHFDTRNSPLITDNVRSIGIDGSTGEVFFGSEFGIVSYRSTATEGGDKHENVYAYPNPVRPGYEGPIAIKGLVRNARVKITDVTGNLVYETTAEGGQATWNGRNFNGDKASSGVYFVFSTNIDGDETEVTKILIVR